MSVVPEPHGHFRKLAATLDVDLVEAVHQDIRDRWFLQKRFQRPESQRFVQNFLDDPVLLRRRHRHALVFQQPLHHAPDFRAQSLLGQRGHALQIEHAEQLFVDRGLQFEGAVCGPANSWSGGLLGWDGPVV